MGSYTLQQLRGYSFDEIKVLFEATMKRVNTFTLMESDDTVPKVVIGSSKRSAEEELGEEKRIEMQGIAKVAIGGIRCGVCRQSGEERGTVLGVNLAGSGDRVLKKMYSVPGSNLKFGKWQERPLKVYRCMAFIVLVVIQLWSLEFINVCTVSP
ncbi:hypothetical protein Tco_0117359 [Tanacetum coccineum]